VPKETPIVSVVDVEAERSMTKAVMSLGTRFSEECVLPRAAAFHAAAGTLFVACAGTDAIVELDTRGLDPARLELRRFPVAAGPLGIAIDQRRNRAVVWSQFDPKVSIVNLDAGARGDGIKTASVSYRPPADVLAMAPGRRIFHATGDHRIARDGSACASCHPDGREDALTWSTPDGPRQTIMLAGRAADSAPYGWIGKHNTLHEYIADTFTRLGGTGIKGGELDALAAYVRGMPGPSADSRGAAPQSELDARGKDIFFSAEQGCASCHAGGQGTDRARHDVSSKAIADDDREFDTPSLRFVRGSAPYLHDGRYQTLEELLTASDTTMGHTLSLSRRDTAALKAYLETL
jgi:hypothetical protein